METLGHAAMVNFIGSVPDERSLLSVPGASLHLYGKTPADGRKLGHVTVVTGTASERERRLQDLERLVRTT